MAGAGPAVFGLALIAAACSSADDTATNAADSTTNTSPADEQTSSSTTKAETNADTLSAATFDGEATTVDGVSFDLGTLANKDLVLWFWAPW